MSPEDDLQSQRIPAIEEMSLNRGWNPISQTEDTHVAITKPNGHNNHSQQQHNQQSLPQQPSTCPPTLNNSTTMAGNHVNGKNGLNNIPTSWSTAPLLKENRNEPNDSENERQHKSNNNEWSSRARDSKNGWKEVPQDDTLNGGSKKNGNGLLNGKNGLHNNGGGTETTTTTNGHSDKLLITEQDPLTGITLRKEADLDELSTCGIGSCQPKWARMFASTHAFMFVFLLAWVLQGMYYTYFVSVITTIEKLFQIKSKTTGLLMSATEIGQIGTALLLTYYAGRGHRPRWIACGMVLFAVSCFGCTIPHYLFGSQLLHASNTFHGGVNSGPSESANSFLLSRPVNASNGLVSAFTSTIPSDAHFNLCKAINSSLHNGTAADKGCESNILEEQVTHSQITNTVLIMFFVSMLGVGIGQTAVSTLGIPYIDDNVASRESPIYIAITIGVRILGPAAGFILGSFCTRLYVDLSDPGFATSDTKWVGAWYLGLVIISSLMILTSIAMFTFPKHLKGNRIPPPMKMRAIEAQKKLEKQEEEAKPQLKDFPKTIKRQLSNDILMFRTASSVLHLLPVAGLYTFLPKYLESQFRLPAHDANLISGIGGILVMGIGIVISGVVILKFSPTARSVAAYIAFTAIVYSAGMAILMFIGCSMDDFIGLKPFANDVAHSRFVPTCNLTCDCDLNKFAPICGIDGMTYFSSCHAGCSSATEMHNKTHYTNCECIPSAQQLKDSLFATTQGDAVSGYCDGKCQSFLLFILLFSFFVFMHSTSEVGSMLLIMRCTDPKDKAMAMGIIQFAIGLFGNVPCPIIYGAVIDSTCLVWETICQKQGACSLYDADAFRHFFFGTTSGIMLLAFIMDLVVWHKAHRIDIDPENNASETELEKPIATTIVPESVV